MSVLVRRAALSVLAFSAFLLLFAALLGAAISGAVLPSEPASAQAPDIATVAVDLEADTE